MSTTDIPPPPLNPSLQCLALMFSWKAQLLYYLRGQKLFGYIDGSIPPPSPLLPASSSSAEPTVNPEYELWFAYQSKILSAIGQPLGESEVISYIVAG